MQRILKGAGFVWKRMRNSLKRNRNEELFRFFIEELKRLKKEAKEGKINLCYFDETGLSLNPNVPYAWQLKGTTAILPAERIKGITILGILDPLQEKFSGNMYQGAANSECVIQTLEEYSKSLKKKTILVLDNAAIHKSKIVKTYVDSWRKRGLYLQFIPAYCPELNLIEILWKHLKHFWLKPKDYISMEVLAERAISILQQYGKEYTITYF